MKQKREREKRSCNPPPPFFLKTFHFFYVLPPWPSSRSNRGPRLNCFLAPYSVHFVLVLKGGLKSWNCCCEGIKVLAHTSFCKSFSFRRLFNFWCSWKTAARTGWKHEATLFFAGWAIEDSGTTLCLRHCTIRIFDQTWVLLEIYY